MTLERPDLAGGLGVQDPHVAGLQVTEGSRDCQALPVRAEPGGQIKTPVNFVAAISRPSRSPRA